MKIAIIGCGLRTPLLIHGLAHSDIGGLQVALYDTAPGRAELMAAIGRVIASGTRMCMEPTTELPHAVEGSSFVISSIRPGEMDGRARDERITMECGFAGQETTGPAGFAMAMRTVPVAIEHARLVQRLAPQAWIINFTNPAGLITQAIAMHAGTRAVGICDTPAELFFRISLGLREPLEEVECDYFGLNHLGWVRAVSVRGVDSTARVFADDNLLRSLYPAELFGPEFLRCLGLIPTEYLYFYYRRHAACTHQISAAATRGEELLTLNQRVFDELKINIRKGDGTAALDAYRRYLNRRNSSYMHLEGAGTSAFAEPEVNWDPFEGATGYHRIAVDAIRALCSATPSRLVLNVPNQGAIAELGDQDVVEVPCVVNRSGARPLAIGLLPEQVRGLVTSVKMYERLTIEAAVGKQRDTAYLALFSNPIVADWDQARNCVDRLLFLNDNRALV